MPRFLIDCDVLIDVFAKREPHFLDSRRVLDYAALHPDQAAVAWHSIPNILYILRRHNPRGQLLELLDYTTIAAGETTAVRAALRGEFADNEDALQVVAAESFRAGYIVTRNVLDYARSPIPAITPIAFLQIVGRAQRAEANG